MISSQAATIIIKTEGALKKDLNLTSLFLKSDFLFTEILRIVGEYQIEEPNNNDGGTTTKAIVGAAITDYSMQFGSIFATNFHNNGCTK